MSVLYGTTYQQFRHFNIDDPRGASDSKSYVAMSHGNYDVWPVHRYRPLIPCMAEILQGPLRLFVHDEKEVDKLSFYIVNFSITTGTALLLFGILTKIGFSRLMSLFGVMIFLGSRETVISVGTPLVDSLYFFSVGVIIYLMLHERGVLLACVFPLIVLSKETILPFLLLPLAVKNMRTWKMFCSIIISLAVFFVFRHFLALETGGPAMPTERHAIAAIAMAHVHAYVFPSLKKVLSLSGMYDLFNGFAFFAVLALWGLIVNLRKRKYKIPSFLLLTVPIGLGFALLSGNFGRMVFISYVPVIAYSLVLLDDCFSTPATERKEN